jgi:DNA repair exonuclease SbcCD nuclease subunit
MFKFLHAADLHLDSPMRGLERYEGAPVDEIRGATRRALENLVQLAIAENVRFVIIAGDLYDTDWKDYNTALFFARQMSRLRAANIDAFIVSGNHDAGSQITRTLSMPENVKLLSAKRPETVLREKLGVAIHGQGFAERAVRDDLSARYPQALKGLFNIGILHTAVNGREGHEPYAPCSVEGLLSKEYDYWALGHVHRREILNENPWLVFPGNIQGRHVNESGPKGCTLVTIEDDSSSSVTHCDLHVLEWARCDVDASGSKSPEDVLGQVRLKLEQQVEAVGERLLAARVQMIGSTEAHRELSSDPEKWATEIRSCATDVGGDRIWIEKIRFGTHPKPIELEERLAQNDAVADLLRTILKTELTPELLEPLNEELAMLRSKLPRELMDEVDALNLQSSESTNQVLEDVKEILVSRLTSIGGAQ